MPRWTEEETQKLIEMLQDGKSSREIVKVLPRTERAIKEKTRRIELELSRPIYTKNFCEPHSEKVPSKEEVYHELVLALLTEFERIRTHLNNLTPQYIKHKPRLYNNLFRCAKTLLEILQAKPEESDIDEWAAIIAEKLPPEMVEPRKLLRKWIPQRKKL